MSWAEREANRRRRVRIDMRSTAGVEIRRRISTYRQAIGKPADAPAVKTRIQTLAELETLVGQLRADGLNGRDIDLTALNRFENTISRLRSLLGLDKPPPEAPMRSLSEVLADE